MLGDVGRSILVGRATEIIIELAMTLKNLLEESTTASKMLQNQQRRRWKFQWEMAKERNIKPTGRGEKGMRMMTQKMGMTQWGLKRG